MSIPVTVSPIDDKEHISYVVFLCLLGGIGCFLSAFSVYLAVKFVKKADADIQNPIELHRIADAMEGGACVQTLKK